MKKLFLLAAAGVLLTSVPALALTDAQCADMWKKADTNNDGTLSGREAERYAASMRIKNKKVPGDKFDQPTFLENCKGDVFTTASVDKGAPLEGANSFTEGQAQDRAVAAGFSSVSPLKKDSKGIWRGTATKDSKKVNVAIDFKGNVVSN